MDNQGRPRRAHPCSRRGPRRLPRRRCRRKTALPAPIPVTSHTRTHRVCLPEYSVEETHVVAGCSLKSDSASPRARKVSARPGGRTIRAYAASRVGGRVSPWLSACLAWPSGATAHGRGEPAAFSVPLADLPPWCLGKLEKVRFAVRLPS
jgi:hypothetical protein